MLSKKPSFGGSKSVEREHAGQAVVNVSDQISDRWYLESRVGNCIRERSETPAAPRNARRVAVDFWQMPIGQPQATPWFSRVKEHENGGDAGHAQRLDVAEARDIRRSGNPN